MTKKNNERDILKMVYNQSRFEIVQESECPDFMLKHYGEKEAFGVEITEFYFSGSNARLQNIPMYMSRLFAGGEPVHKDDVEVLKIQQFTHTGADGEHKGIINGIVREVPPTPEYVRMIASTITRKDGKFSNYNPNLSHVNLLILDHEQRLATLPSENFYQFFFTSDIQSVLVQTAFREILFITKLKDTGRVYVPLKLLLLVSTFYLFCEALQEYEPAKEYDSSNDILQLFALYLQHRNIELYLVKNTSSEVEVVWSNYGLLLNDTEIVIRDYADYRQPLKVDPAYNPSYAFLDPPLLEFLEEFMDLYTVESNMAYEVLQDATFWAS